MEAIVSGDTRPSWANIIAHAFMTGVLVYWAIYAWQN